MWDCLCDLAPGLDEAVHGCQVVFLQVCVILSNVSCVYEPICLVLFDLQEFLSSYFQLGFSVCVWLNMYVDMSGSPTATAQICL